MAGVRLARGSHGAPAVTRSLADLKAKPKSLPTRIVPKICLDLEALADVQRLDRERADLEDEKAALLKGRQQVGEDGETKGPPKRTGEGAPPPRVAEIVTRLAEIDDTQEGLLDRMRESEGDILLRAIGSGEWQRFKDENPPREGNKSDGEFGYDLCNATQLMADLGRYVVSWGDQNLEPGAWDEWFGERVAPGDQADIAKNVVQNQEARITVPKARSIDSSGTPASGNASA